MPLKKKVFKINQWCECGVAFFPGWWVTKVSSPVQGFWARGQIQAGPSCGWAPPGGRCLPRTAYWQDSLGFVRFVGFVGKWQQSLDSPGDWGPAWWGLIQVRWTREMLGTRWPILYLPTFWIGVSWHFPSFSSFSPSPSSSGQGVTAAHHPCRIWIF